MTTLPIRFPNINESIYAGFWRRLGAFWLDVTIGLPLIFILQYVNSFDKTFNYVTFIPFITFAIFYNIYCVKRWGGTPGKLIAKIKIVRLDGKDVNWKEAILRHIVELLTTIIYYIFVFIALSKMSNQEYISLSNFNKSKRMIELCPSFYRYIDWFNNIWIWSEFIVLLTNKRKRALHDFIAGTVVIKKKYKRIAVQQHIADDLSAAEP